MLLTAVAASASFPLEAHLRDQSDEGRRERSSGHSARQCDRCGHIQSRSDVASAGVPGASARCMLPTILAGKFAVDRRIGAGGMGVVYKGHDLTLDRVVALKTLPRLSAGEATQLRREARAMASVEHPHLADIYASEVWRGAPVLVLEHLPGGTLADRLAGTPLPIGDRWSWASRWRLRDHLHGLGMLHRDVKPSNIGYTGDGIPKLMDFGLVRLTSVSVAPDDTTSLAVLKDAAAAEAVQRGESFGATQPLVGTAAYLSPEAVSLQAPDNSFDLWALAVTFYEAVSGRNPFAASTPVEDPAADHFRADTAGAKPEARLSEALNEFLSSALSRDLRKRPGTAAEFLEGLRAVQRAHAALVGGAAVAG